MLLTWRLQQSRIRKARLFGFLTLTLMLGGIGQLPSSAEAQLTGFTQWQYYCDYATPAGMSCGLSDAHSYSFNSAKHLDGHASSPTVCAAIDTNVAGSGSPVGRPSGMACAPDFARLCLAGQVYPNCTDWDDFTAIAVVINDGVIAHTVRGHRGW